MSRLTPPGEPPDQKPEEIVIDHVLWRRAPLCSCVLGVAVALALLVFAPAGPWWMPFLVFCVVAAVAFRFLRPRARQPGWEDEI